jgi:hypothetical protein
MSTRNWIILAIVAGFIIWLYYSNKTKTTATMKATGLPASGAIYTRDPVTGNVTKTIVAV